MDEQNIIKKFSCKIIPEKLYFFPNEHWKKVCSHEITYCFATDDTLVFQGLSDHDFGPLNIGCIYSFSKKITSYLVTPSLKDKIIIYHVKEATDVNILNSAFLVGSFMIINLGFSPEDAHQILHHPYQSDYIKFTDSSFHTHDYEISLLDCLRAVKLGIENKFYKASQFDLYEYTHYEKVESGDMNWIIPDRFMAMCSPCDMPNMVKNGMLHTPEFYYPIFKKFNIKTLVRLNSKLYDSEKFERNKIKHYDLIFQDGSAPSDEITMAFFDIVDSNPGAIAVHCKAGLGRTGTLIAAYLMSRYKFSANEAIAWLRICRSGSVIGIQQDWLNEKESWFKSLFRGTMGNSMDSLKEKMPKKVILSRENSIDSFYNLRNRSIPRSSFDYNNIREEEKETKTYSTVARSNQYVNYDSSRYPIQPPLDYITNEAVSLRNDNRHPDNDLDSNDATSQGDNLNKKKLLRDSIKAPISTINDPTPSYAQPIDGNLRTDKRKSNSVDFESEIGLPRYKAPVLFPFRSVSNENLSTPDPHVNNLSLSMDTSMHNDRSKNSDYLLTNNPRYTGAIARKVEKKKKTTFPIIDRKRSGSKTASVHRGSLRNEDNVFYESTVARTPQPTRNTSSSLARLRELFRKPFEK